MTFRQSTRDKIEIMPVYLQCPVANCTLGNAGAKWRTANLEDENIAMNLVNQHLVYNHQQAPALPPPAQPRAEKIEKPKLALKDGQLDEAA